MFSACLWPAPSTASGGIAGRLAGHHGGSVRHRRRRPPRPVLIDIPKDIQLAQGDLHPHLMPVDEAPAFPAAALAEAAELLAQAQKTDAVRRRRRGHGAGGAGAA